MRKIGKEKKRESFGRPIKIWDLSHNITHKTMNYLKYM
jgi:predicted transcriptional regulator